jgi:hypothetical protein
MDLPDREIKGSAMPDKNQKIIPCDLIDEEGQQSSLHIGTLFSPKGVVWTSCSLQNDECARGLGFNPRLLQVWGCNSVVECSLRSLFFELFWQGFIFEACPEHWFARNHLCGIWSKMYHGSTQVIF